MTKREAISMFRSEILPSIPRTDKVARRCYWNDFTDSLCKDRSITEKQYENWTNPFDT